MGAAGVAAAAAALTPPREQAPDPPVTVRAALGAASARLRARGMATPWLDAAVLLAHSLGVSKERLFAAYPERLPELARLRFERLLERRAAGEPVAYLRGYKEFYGRPFIVDRRVLIPRPETELLVEALLRYGDALAAERGSVALHDVGTGSGAIAVTVQLERPAWRASASDISPPAVAAALRNRDGLGAGALRLRVCDLLPPAPARWDLIVANPPYLTGAEVAELRRRGWPEPALALDGGGDGLGPSRRLIDGARRRLRPGGALILETAAGRAAALARCLERRGFAPPELWHDLAGLPRVLIAHRRQR
jgi:release factor glutamine methyltransferase